MVVLMFWGPADRILYRQRSVPCRVTRSRHLCAYAVPSRVLVVKQNVRGIQNPCKNCIGRMQDLHNKSQNMLDGRGLGSGSLDSYGWRPCVGPGNQIQ